MFQNKNLLLLTAYLTRVLCSVKRKIYYIIGTIIYYVIIYLTLCIVHC